MPWAVSEIWDVREGSIVESNTREYARSFRVIGTPYHTAKYYGPETILLLPGIPRRGDLYRSAAGVLDTGAWCREVECRQDQDTPWVWVVVATYSSAATPQTGPGSPDWPENPLLRPAEISWEDFNLTYILAEDWNRTPILNSAGQPFDPPIEEELSEVLLLRIVQNVATFDPLTIGKYRGAMNSEPFLGLAQHKVWCRKLTGSSASENGISYWKRTIEFAIITGTDADSPMPDWKRRVLDQGHMAFDEITEDLRNVVDPNTGQPLAGPALLDGEGYQLAQGSDPVFLTFRTKPQRDFNELNIF